MLNLLIADDEKIIRTSLAKGLDWHNMGIRVVGCCANGLEALDCIIDESPDIVITDIKMPGLSGLELIHKIQEIDRDIEFIILSGYREFDFAKKAMELGVRRYLLKPVSEEEVLAAVKDAIESYEQKRSAKTVLGERNYLQTQIAEYHRLRLQYALIFHADSLDRAVETYMDHFYSREDCYIYAALKPKDIISSSRLVCQIVPPLLSTGLSLVLDCFYAKETLYVIVRGATKHSAELFRKIVLECEPSLRISALIEAPLHTCMQRLYRELVCYSKVYTVAETITAHELNSSGLPLAAIQEISQTLSSMADSGAHEAVVHDYLLDQLASVEDLQALRASGANLIVEILSHRQTSDVELEGVFEKIYREKNCKELLDRIIRISLSLIYQKPAGSNLVQIVKSYVHNNLADSALSLKQIAAQSAHANADYLSRLFVQETGEKFSHYLNRKRIEKAKLLLQEDSSKVYLVAEQVGLGHNPRYFGQVFKKHTGLTPSMYAQGIADS